MTLATLDDIAARLGRPLTVEEETQLPGLLSEVSAAAVLRSGQSFVRQEHRCRARVKRGMVRLSQRPVHDVLSVTTRFGEPVTHDWDGLDRVHVQCVTLGRAPVQVVDVVYDAGPDEVPPVIVGLVCSIAMRSLGVNPVEAATVQIGIDGYTETIGGAGAARSFGLLPDEAKILDSYRRSFCDIAVAW